jgi:hypothetical protein
VAGRRKTARFGAREMVQGSRRQGGWHVWCSRGHGRAHLAVLDDRVELRGKHRLAAVFPVGHSQPVAITCTSCTMRLMSKSRTQQGRLGFGFGFRLGFMVDDLWFCWQGLDVAIRPRNARGGCSSSVVCAPAHTPAQTHAFAQTCPLGSAASSRQRNERGAERGAHARLAQRTSSV